MRTLHWYIFRELFKTFLITTVATTALFTMAGGIYNVVRQEGVGGAEIFDLVPMLMPIFLPITTAISALFAVTSIFGRLAADNEFVACRAAGINIYKLFLAPIILSLFVAALSMVTWNFVVPQQVAAIRDFVKSNIHGMAKERFQTRGYIRLGDRYLVTARAIDSRFEESALVERGWDPQLNYFNVEKPSFLQLDENGEVVRFVTADSGWIVFNTLIEPIEITAIVSNARDFSNGQVTHVEQQTLGPISRELPRRENPSLLSLPDLWKVLDQPSQYSELRSAFAQFQQLFLRRYVLSWAAHIMETGEAVRFERSDGTIVGIRAEIVEENELKRLRLGNVVADSNDTASTKPNRFIAPTGILRPILIQGRSPSVEVKLMADDTHRVTLSRTDINTGRPREQDDYTITNLIIPQEILDLADELDADTVISSSESLIYSDPAIDTARDEMQSAAAALRREVIAIFHQRFGYAASPLVTTLMGAALGLIFRGSRALAAFGLSAIPLALATMFIIVGWQTAEKEGTEFVGAFIIWGGLAAVGIGNVLLIGMGVRR